MLEKKTHTFAAVYPRETWRVLNLKKPPADVEMQPAPKSEAAFEDTWPADPGPSPLVAAEAEQTEQPEFLGGARKGRKKHWRCVKDTNIYPLSKALWRRYFIFPRWDMLVRRRAVKVLIGWLRWWVDMTNGWKGGRSQIWACKLCSSCD